MAHASAGAAHTQAVQPSWGSARSVDVEYDRDSFVQIGEGTYGQARTA